MPRTGNCATKILGRTGSAEVMQPDYRFLEQDICMAVTRLYNALHTTANPKVHILFQQWHRLTTRSVATRRATPI